MAKKVKMKVVKGKYKKTSQKPLLIIVLFPFILIHFFWKLLIQIPKYQSGFLGFIRIIFWTAIIWNMSFLEKLSKAQEMADSSILDQIFPLFGFILCLIMITISIFVMMGLNTSNFRLDNDKSEYHNINSTMSILDSKLSSYKDRNSFIKKFIE